MKCNLEYLSMHYSNFTLCLGKEEIDTTTKASLLYAVPLLLLSLGSSLSLRLLHCPMPISLGTVATMASRAPAQLSLFFLHISLALSDHPYPNLD